MQLKYQQAAAVALKIPLIYCGRRKRDESLAKEEMLVGAIK